MIEMERHIPVSAMRIAAAAICCMLSFALAFAPLFATVPVAFADASSAAAQAKSDGDAKAHGADSGSSSAASESSSQEDASKPAAPGDRVSEGEPEKQSEESRPASDEAAKDEGAQNDRNVQDAADAENGQDAQSASAAQDAGGQQGAQASDSPQVSEDNEAAQSTGKTAPRKAGASLSPQAATAASGEKPQPTSAELMYRNPKTGKYELFPATTSENDPQTVLATGDAAYFDVQVTYSDGSSERASKVGLAVSWKLGNNKHAGKQVVSIDGNGKMTLSGVSSKLVQLKAQVGKLDVDRCPAYVNLVGKTEKPSTGKTIDSVSITYSGSGDGQQGSSNPAKAADDGASSEPVPTITMRGGSLLFDATITFVDANGNMTTSSGSFADAMLAWQIVALYNQMGERTDTLIAKAENVGQMGKLTATESGDGWVVIRCSSNAYPGFAGQEMLVRIAGNLVQDPGVEKSNTMSGAQLVYKNDGSDSYQAYAGTAANTPAVISKPGGSVGFDAMILFANGARARAADLGLAVDYSLAGNVTSAGVSLAQMAPDGTLAATHFKNGTVRIAGAEVNGMDVAGTSAYVRISNNDASVKPTSDALEVSATSNYWISASQRPDDPTADWYWRAVVTKGDGAHTVPLVVSSPGSSSSCKLEAAVHWSNSQVTSSKADDGADREWSLGPSVDSKGVACLPLVYVSADGTVRPTGAGSGYATVRCTVKLPLYDVSGAQLQRELTGEYRIAVYTSKSYVKTMVLLDESGKPIKTSSITLKSGKNTYNFGAKITYVGYDEKTGKVSEYDVAVPADRALVEGLEWKVYRTEERKDDELYSQIREDGSFRAQSGFARGYVYANLKGASFAGKDIGVGVMVIAEDSIDKLGHTDSMEVSMYHYSDYMKRGDEAKPAKQVTLTRAQLSAMADYTTWYTFQRRGDAYSTVYARGVTMRNLLALCGVDPDRLISMAFMGSDGYFAERHSADFILGTQYRYTNYYYHSSLPGLMGAQSVSPMLALSYYMKNNAGYEDATDKSNARDAGFGYMTSDSTLRVIFGMTGPNVRNANQSISNVNRITIIVEDNTFPPDEKKEDEKTPDVPDPETPPTPNDEQHGTPGVQGTENGGNTSNPFAGQSNEGVGTDAKHGGSVAVAKGAGEAAEVGEAEGTNDHADDKGSQSGQSTQDSDQAKGETDQSGNPLIRELRENAKPVLPPAEIDSIWWTGVATTSLLAFFIGGLFSGRRYAVDRADGMLIGTRARKRE